MDPGEPALLLEPVARTRGRDAAAVIFKSIPSALRPNAQHRRALRGFARTLSATVAEGRSFTCLVSDDEQLRSLNRDFLGHDYATDVLSFPFEAAGLPAPTLGDIAISLQRAHAQAAEFGHSPFDELRILMLHGVLHLTGLDHETDRGEMRAAEHHWRTVFDLPNILTGRVTAAAKP